MYSVGLFEHGVRALSTRGEVRLKILRAEGFDYLSRTTGGPPALAAVAAGGRTLTSSLVTGDVLSEMVWPSLSESRARPLLMRSRSRFPDRFRCMASRRSPGRHLPRSVALRSSPLVLLAMAAAEVDLRYWRLWVSGDGETHVTQARMGGFELVGYSSAPQAVREKGIPEPTKVIFTELPAGFDNPWHHCPSPQFVVVCKGSWYVETTDGTRVTLGTQDVLYQDNTLGALELVGETEVRG